MNQINRIFSYLFPITQHKSSDKNGDPLFVDLYKGRYRLSTPHAVYSFDDLYDNFFQTFEKINLLKYKTANILLLGGGLGSVPFMLEKKFKLDASFSIIEYDINIIELFNKYTNPRLKSQITFLNMNAELAVEMLQDTFDIIIIDLFDHDEIPTQFKSQEFLKQCENLLEKNGIVLFNWLTISDKHYKLCIDYFNSTYLQTFPQSTYNRTKYNTILISDKSIIQIT